MSHTEIKLPDRCLTALRYYVGEASARPELPQDPKAYNTLNALFFDGISTERARASEGRPLNGELLLFPEALISLGRDLLQALEPGKADAADGPLYRVERRQTHRPCGPFPARSPSLPHPGRGSWMPMRTNGDWC